MGKGVMNAVNNVNGPLRDLVIGMDATNQKELDYAMIEADGTETKSKYGANAILGISMAAMRASANEAGLPLYKYIGNGTTLPRPMMNIINGGAHADNKLDFQEFMIIPMRDTIKERVRVGAEVFHNLKKVLNAKGLATGVGDEGGFAPNVKDEDEALALIMEATQKAGYKPGEEIMLALDVAATEMYDEAKKIGKDGNYHFWKIGVTKTTDEMIAFYEDLVNRYPIISIEDGLAEEDWEGWEALTDKLGEKIQIVGDDIFVTNIDRLNKGIENGVANSILIKPNQIGTLTETLDAIRIAKEAGYGTVISHRSGETEDTTIADIAVAVNSGQIKIGAPCRTDRVAKYNRLLNIEDECNGTTLYAVF